MTDQSIFPSLAGRTALVTGGAKRIGRGIALALAQRGADIIISYNRSEKAACETCREAEKNKVKALPVQADLSNPSDAEGLIRNASSKAGTVDILINNASIFEPSTLTNFSVERFRKTMDLNTVSPAVLADTFVRQAKTGDIINMLDTRIKGIDPGHVLYQMSKKILSGLTGTMAASYAPSFRVNGVAPGFILPPAEAHLPEEKKHGPKLLLHCEDRTSEVTKAVMFFLSSRFITGQVLFVDGGEHIKRELI